MAVSFVDGRVTSFDAHFAAEVGVHRNVEVVSPSYQLLADLVIGTTRIATLQTRLAQKLATVRPIKVLPLPAPLPTFEEAMVWHARFDGDEAHQRFRRRLLQTAGARDPIGYALASLYSASLRRSSTARVGSNSQFANRPAKSRPAQPAASQKP